MIATPKIFEFGDCMLDCDRFELTRAGHRVKIERKPMELLILLVTKQGTLLTRDEIAASLWSPDVFVDVNTSINTIIRKVRYALRDSAEEPRYVETVSGKGYRFASEVVMKASVDGSPVNGAIAAAVPIAAPLQSLFEAALMTPLPSPSRSTAIRRFVWLGIACSGILAIAALTSYLFHNRWHRVEYAQLTDFADSASAPSLSADGRMLTFLGGGTFFLSSNQIYVKMLPSGQAKRLTDDLQWKYHPVFSPDGSEIAYTVLDGTIFDTKVVPVLGGESRLLLNNAAGLTWLSADEVLFSRVPSGLHMGVMRGNLVTQQFRDLYFPAKEEEMAHFSFADYGQLEFSQGQLKFPMAGKANAIQVRDGLYGERSAGKATLSTGRAEVFVRVGGGEGGHGPEDSAKVPTESAHAKRDAKEAYMENATGSVFRQLGRDSAVACR